MGAGQQVLAAVSGGGGGGVGAHRYWRITNIALAGSFFEISELQFTVSGVEQAGTMDASAATGFGDVSDLNDGNFTTRCYWVDAAVESPAIFWVRMDLGGAIALTGVKLAGFDDGQYYPVSFDVQYSDDNSAWTHAQTFTPSYPGDNTNSAEMTF